MCKSQVEEKILKVKTGKGEKQNMNLSGKLSIIIILSMITLSSCSMDVAVEEISETTARETTSSDAISPSAGSEISFTHVNEHGMTVNWGTASDNQTITANLSYKLIKATSSHLIDSVSEAEVISGADLLLDWTVAQTHQTITGLSEGTEYHFAVLVKDEASNLTLYAPMSQTTATSLSSSQWILFPFQESVLEHNMTSLYGGL